METGKSRVQSLLVVGRIAKTNPAKGRLKDAGKSAYLKKVSERNTGEREVASDEDTVICTPSEEEAKKAARNCA